MLRLFLVYLYLDWFLVQVLSLVLVPLAPDPGAGPGLSSVGLGYVATFEISPADIDSSD